MKHCVIYGWHAFGRAVKLGDCDGLPICVGSGEKEYTHNDGEKVSSDPN
jgi:hypothetical protein